MAHQTIFLELGQRGPPLLDLRRRDRPVNLVEVDRVDPQPLQAVVGLTPYRVPLQAVHDPAVAAFKQRALGEHVRSLGDALQRATDDLLGAAEAVGGGGVNPIDPLLERAVDRGDRLLIVLRTPAELPVPAADRPRAEADAGDLEARLAELCCLECCLVHGRSSR